jgi:hypothetical protein
LADTLDYVLTKQNEFQAKLGTESGADLKSVSSLIHTHSQFAVEEIYEMLRELPYHKPWKDYSSLSIEEVVEKMEKVEFEWIDAFIFMMNVANLLKMDSEKIKQLYNEKLSINHKRQEDPELGYVKETV